MRELFLGKPWHWALLVVIAALLWWAGDMRVHVTDFNSFVIALIVGSFAVVLLLLRTTRPGETVTRDPLEDDATD